MHDLLTSRRTLLGASGALVVAFALRPALGHTQPAPAGAPPAHIACGRPHPGRPGITTVVPTIHHTYCDYV